MDKSVFRTSTVNVQNLDLSQIRNLWWPNFKHTLAKTVFFWTSPVPRFPFIKKLSGCQMSICDLNTTTADCKRAKSFSHCGLVNEKICGCSVRPELDDGTVGSGVATVQNFESGTCHLNCGKKNKNGKDQFQGL